jgi:hypothetical protein
LKYCLILYVHLYRLFMCLGHYCLHATPPLPCPEGTFNNNTGLAMASECTHCSVGKYCEGLGNVVPDGDCYAGQYCYRQAKSPVPLSNNALYPQNGPCICGHYCPNGTYVPVPCPQGSYKNDTGGASVADCLPCKGGYYCGAQSRITIKNIIKIHKV